MEKETLQVYSDVFDAIAECRDALSSFTSMMAPRNTLPLRLTMMNALIREVKGLEVQASAARSEVVLSIAQSAKSEYDALIKAIGLNVTTADRMVDLRAGYMQVHQRTDVEYKRSGHAPAKEAAS